MPDVDPADLEPVGELDAVDDLQILDGRPHHVDVLRVHVPVAAQHAPLRQPLVEERRVAAERPLHVDARRLGVIGAPGPADVQLHLAPLALPPRARAGRAEDRGVLLRPLRLAVEGHHPRHQPLHDIRRLRLLGEQRDQHAVVRQAAHLHRPLHDLALPLAGDPAVIGAPGHDHGCPNPEVYGNCTNFGAAYVFRFDGVVWVEVAELQSPRSNPGGDNFGRSAAISGDTLLIGATYALGNGLTSGSTYVFDLDPVFGDVDCDGAVGITDFLALLSAWGPNPGHPADLDGDGFVGITDFLFMLASWS